MASDDRESLYTTLVAQGLDDADKIVFGRSLKDLMAGVVAYLGLVFLSNLGLFGLEVLAVLFILMTFALISLFRAAESKPLEEFISAKIHRLQLPDTTYSKYISPKDSDSYDRVAADGGVAKMSTDDLTENPGEIRIWEADRYNEDFTQIENVYPQFDIIERTDGVFVKAMRVNGTSVHLRSIQEQNNIATRYGNRIGDIDAPLTVFLTTEKYDINEHQRLHRERSNKADFDGVTLDILAQGYQRDVIGDPRVQSTRRRRIYLIITADPEEHDVDVDSGPSASDPASLIEQLNPFSTDPTFTREELKMRQQMFANLEEIEQNTIQMLEAIDSVQIDPISYQEHLGLYRGHWRGPLDSDPIDMPFGTITPPESLRNRDSDEGGLLA